MEIFPSCVGLKREWLELLNQLGPIPSFDGPPAFGVTLPEDEIDENAILVPLHPCPGLIVRPHYHRQGLRDARPMVRVRESLLTGLHKAASVMPAGFCLTVVDGWRSEATQRAVFDQIRDAAESAGSSPSTFAFNLDELGVRSAYPSDDAPHRTGGAVDVLLVGPDGKDWGMGTGFDAVSTRSATAALELDVSQAYLLERLGRRILYHAMTNAGFTNYPAEWWHYDYGNAFWRFYGGRPPGPMFRTIE